MNFIKKVQDKNFDESVHMQFQKFSKGEFKNRAIVHAKASGGKYTINTSAEFANELVRDVAEKLGSKKTKVEGAIVSTLDLKKDLEFKEIKQFQGVKKYMIENEMSGSEIITLLNKFPKAFFALSFDAGEETILKIKPKAPKSGKPGTKGEEAPKPDFCKLITRDKKLAESFIFEVPEFKSAIVIHDFFIDKIEVPEELKNSEDFALIREKSKRIGRILRKSVIDEKRIEKELELRA
ncbi:MAG: hypothetical protein AABY32_03160 [Nanoarchaeota archaeon]